MNIIKSKERSTEFITNDDMIDSVTYNISAADEVNIKEALKILNSNTEMKCITYPYYGRILCYGNDTTLLKTEVESLIVYRDGIFIEAILKNTSDIIEIKTT